MTGPGGADGQPDPQSADRHALFEQAYRLHASVVFTHCVQRGVSFADAEDLTGDVFAIAWRRRIDAVEDPSAGMLPWLLGIANNLLRTRVRSQTRWARALRRLPAPLVEPDLAVAFADRAQDLADLVVLRRVLAGLSVAEQEVIQLCVIRGFTPAVVAQTTGESAGTVRSRLSRALVKARALFAAEEAAASPDAPGVAGLADGVGGAR